jgi:hypothetical protein
MHWSLVAPLAPLAITPASIHYETKLEGGKREGKRERIER